jgi:hypothetical protein
VTEVVVAGAVLLLLSVLFWKLRIFDSGVNPTIEVGPVDLYVEVTPMNVYGFGALKHGHLPLWNPYQLCGVPFLAAGYVGLFYPLHAMNLWFDVLTSFEIAFILHMFLGGLTMWWLCRHFGVRLLGGLVAAVTFMWSGWVILNNTLPGVFEAMMWMPLTVGLLDRTVQGRRWAWLWLTLALACQILLGAAEIFVHTMYVGGLFVLCRIVQMSWHGGWRAALRGMVVLVACGVAAVLLAAPQLLPAVELTQQSGRAAGALSFAQAAMAAIPPLLFLRIAVVNVGVVAVGVLPLLGLVLVFGAREQRLASVAALIAAVAAALLVFGGPVYRLYYDIPVVGSLFRRPMKFLDIYAFAQALLAGVAVTQLEAWSRESRRRLWRRPTWLAALVMAGAAVWWMATSGPSWWAWGATAGLLVLFGVLPWRVARMATLVGLCVLQGATLFFTVGDTHVRPIKRPEIFYTFRPLLDQLKAQVGEARVYLSPKFLFSPGLTAKQGQIVKLPVVTDYEPLAVGRYAKFFGAVTPWTDPTTPFFGIYNLLPTSGWKLMDLTGTRFFVMLRGEAGDQSMAANPAEFRVVYDQAPVRVFEKVRVLPRAYFAPRARVVPPDAVLETLDTAGFDPQMEVLLEEPGAEPIPLAPGGNATGAVHITSYEPERVEIDADVSAPGYLVLADLHYPGWKAFIGNKEVPIYRANYLFRAVRLPLGSSAVRFEYQPQSFRIGMMLSGATVALLACLVVWARVTQQRSTVAQPVR